jgi:hypothetical protein
MSIYNVIETMLPGSLEGGLMQLWAHEGAARPGWINVIEMK